MKADHQENQEAEDARQVHVDSQLRRLEKAASRHVWDNPILWRETCTWAYGRKVLVIRLAYWILFGMAIVALWSIVQQPIALRRSGGLASVVEATALPSILLFFVSLVIMNALAVTTVTNGVKFCKATCCFAELDPEM